MGAKKSFQDWSTDILLHCFVNDFNDKYLIHTVRISINFWKFAIVDSYVDSIRLYLSPTVITFVFCEYMKYLASCTYIYIYEVKEIIFLLILLKYIHIYIYKYTCINIYTVNTYISVTVYKCVYMYIQAQQAKYLLVITKYKCYNRRWKI